MILIAQVSAIELTQQLRQMLLPVAFVWCIIGLWDTVWKQGADVKVILGAILRVLIVTLFIWKYPEFIWEGREALNGLREDVFLQAGGNEFHKVLMAEIKTQPGTVDFVGQICSALLYAIQGFGRLMLSILMFLQTFCLEGLMAVSPILLGFLAWDLTRPMGVQFCFTTLGILLWEVGVLIIDILLIGLGEQFLKPALAAGATLGAAGVITGVASWPLFLNAIIIAALLPAFLYLSVPFIITSILRGSDPTGPLLLKAMQTASMGFGGSLGAMMPNVTGMAGAVGGVSGGGVPFLSSLRGGGGGTLGNVSSGSAGHLEGGKGMSFSEGGVSPMEKKGGFIQPLASLSSEKSGSSTSLPTSPSASAVSSPNTSSPLSEEPSGAAASPPVSTFPSGSSGSGVSAQVEISPAKKGKEKENESRDTNVGEIYVGKHGHVFQQTSPTEFSCRNPHTGYTSHHEGNIGLRNVANRSLFSHNAERATMRDLIPHHNKKSNKV